MKSIAAKCISIDRRLRHSNGSNWFREGQRVSLVARRYHSSRNRYYQVMPTMFNLAESDTPGILYAPGFEFCRFKIVGESGRFIKSNRSAAIGQIEIDWTRCKRSIRNQARNIAKELYSIGALERIARGYKR